MIGRVVSTKTNHTVTVLVSRTAKHPLYKKTFIQSKKYLVDTDGNVKEGDVVEVVKIRPISKNKHWRAVKVIGQNLAEIVEAKQKQAAEEIIAEVMPEEKESSNQNQELSNKKKEKTKEVKEVKKESKNKKA